LKEVAIPFVLRVHRYQKSARRIEEEVRGAQWQALAWRGIPISIAYDERTLWRLTAFNHNTDATHKQRSRWANTANGALIFSALKEGHAPLQAGHSAISAAS